jgi:2-polyprenyl-6-methoxyphenol hydroxylase-like FAD-dependent oxidoreductase
MESSYQVIIIGGGPVGATLAVFLASQSVSTLVLERDPAIPSVPRAFSIDDEAMRILQAYGLRDRVVSDACHEPSSVSYHATAEPGAEWFLELESTRDLGNGHGALQFFHQPILEKVLGEEFEKRAKGTGRFVRGATVVRVENFLSDENGPCRVYYLKDGTEHLAECTYVIGADGKTGTVRNQTLKNLVHMDGTRYPEPWITVSAQILPVPDSFPLLHPPHSFTREQIHDLYFPREFRFVCDPTRPSIASRVGPPQDRQYRWEWMVQPGDIEHAQKLLGDKTSSSSDPEHPESSLPAIQSIMSQHNMLNLTLSGAIYTYPWSSLRIIRNQTYRFDMRIAREWKFGKLMLAGDAAHTMPPFVRPFRFSPKRMQRN